MTHPRPVTAALLMTLTASAILLGGCGGGTGADRATDRAHTATTPATASATSPAPAMAPDTAPPTAPATAPTTLPANFVASVSPVSAADLGASWREGCPVGPEQLRRLSLAFWDFDGHVRTGALVVHADMADAVTAIFRQLFAHRVPIRRMEPIDVYGGNDDASMAADNTSGFNCRLAVTTGPPQWSAHAYGRAIDVNPIENPYVLGRDVLPPAGAAYLDRADVRPGMATAVGPLVDAFTAAGWQWGGHWAGSPDYQHFSAGGS